MSARVQRAAKKGSKILGYFLFLVLFLLNVQIGFSDNQTGEIELLGMKISLNDLIAKEALPPEDGGGGGGSDNKLKAKECVKDDGSIGWKTTCDNPTGQYCLPGQGSGICV